MSKNSAEDLRSRYGALDRHTYVEPNERMEPPPTTTNSFARLQLGATYTNRDDSRFLLQALVQRGQVYLQILFGPECGLGIADLDALMRKVFDGAQTREFVPGEVVPDSEGGPAAVVPRGWYVVYEALPCAASIFLGRKAAELSKALDAA